MSDKFVINGRTIDTSLGAEDASSSNYILIRTKGEPLGKAQRQKLTKLNVIIEEFVGNESDQIYLCGYKLDSLQDIRALDYIDYVDVYAPKLAFTDQTRRVSAQADATPGHDPLEVDILLHHDIGRASEALVAEIAEKAGVPQSAISQQNGLIHVAVTDPKKLEAVAAIDEVRVIHPTNERSLFNNVARRILHADTATVNNTVYKGKGQIVCVADTGFDKGDPKDVHKAFVGRVKHLVPLGRPDSENADDPNGHGTHVCGSVLGSGQHSSFGLIEGTAPAAELFMQSLLSDPDAQGRTGLSGIPDDLSDLFSKAYEYDATARVHTNSWGSPLPPNGRQLPYNSSAEAIDNFVYQHQDMTILFAAGNDGQDSDLDGKVNERSLGAEASAKNCITVGASENYRPDLKSGNSRFQYTYGGFWPRDFPKNPLKDDHLANNAEGLAAFSSRGPTAENRLKPDIVAPGTAILSTRSQHIAESSDDINISGVSEDKTYMYLSGTSMATPLVAGCCAVLREALSRAGYQDVKSGKTNPTGSLIRALLINGAISIKGQYMPKEIGNEPNSHSGFGRVDLARSVVKPNDPFSGYGVGHIDDNDDDNAEVDDDTVTIEIPIPEKPAQSSSGLTFKATLVYADRAGAALAIDLNLVVVAGDKERHGNQINQEFPLNSREAFDRRNNVEQVVWSQIPGKVVKLIVKPYRLLGGHVPFAYAWRFD